MKRSTPFLIVGTLAAGLLLTGCQGSSHSCVNGKCHVTVTGTGQNIEVDDFDMTVTRIGTGEMTISVEGSQPVTIKKGERGQVGPVSIQVTSVDGDKVKFDVN